MEYVTCLEKAVVEGSCVPFLWNICFINWSFRPMLKSPLFFLLIAAAKWQLDQVEQSMVCTSLELCQCSAGPSRSWACAPSGTALLVVGGNSVILPSARTYHTELQSVYPYARSSGRPLLSHTLFTSTV